MGELTKHAIVDAPVARVYSYVANPHNAPHYISAIQRIISGPEVATSAGQRWQAAAHFMGRPVEITLVLDDLAPPRGVRFVMEGDPLGILSIWLDPDSTGARTRASLTLKVPSVPGFLLNGLMGGMLAADMARLKKVLEQ